MAAISLRTAGRRPRTSAATRLNATRAASRGWVAAGHRQAVVWLYADPRWGRVNALIAELAGEIARVAALSVPDLVLMELDPELARAEPDPEIQALIRASAGLNLALDYLPGSTTFDAVADPPTAQLASSIVWLDAFVSNVDRTARNPNMLIWHRRLWLIDHGAALYFHHAGGDYRPRDGGVRKHRRSRAARSGESDCRRRDVTRLDEKAFCDIVALIPDTWLKNDSSYDTPDQRRDAYVDCLTTRMQAPRTFAEEAMRPSRHL